MKNKLFSMAMFGKAMIIVVLAFGMTVTSCKEPNTPTPVTLVSILVTKLPDKKAYLTNESFNKAGIEITGSYSDNTTKLETKYILSAVDTSTTGTKTVTVSFNGKTTTFTITVSPVTYSISLDITGTPTFPAADRLVEDIDHIVFAPSPCTPDPSPRTSLFSKARERDCGERAANFATVRLCGGAWNESRNGLGVRGTSSYSISK